MKHGINKNSKPLKKYIFVAEYNTWSINNKIVMSFKNKIIGEWVIELLHKQIHFRTPSYMDTYYDCFEEDFDEMMGQTNLKFCFHDIKTMKDIENEIKKGCHFRREWIGQYVPSEEHFTDKIKKIILLQNKVR